MARCTHDLLQAGWPERLHSAVTVSPSSAQCTLLTLTALAASLGQEDPVTAALDLMLSGVDANITPVELRQIVSDLGGGR